MDGLSPSPTNDGHINPNMNRGNENNNNKDNEIIASQEQTKPLLYMPLTLKDRSYLHTGSGNMNIDGETSGENHYTSNHSTCMSDDNIPTNVSTEEQLALLPPECLSNVADRPLQHYHEDNVTITTYSLQPMLYSVIVILLVEGIERFVFYGINYTQTSYLTGEYSDTYPKYSDWNANMDAISASSYVSISVAVAYTTPFIGAYFADQLFGDYYTIIIGILCFYIPGILIIALTTIPNVLGTTFNNSFLTFGLLILWPTGTGIVKSVVNVFGAKQYHPLLQSSLIESYYVNFYMCINIGALIGGFIVPLLAQRNVTVAYFLPLILLFIGMILFISRSSRFVITKPKSDHRKYLLQQIKVWLCCTKMKPKKRKVHHHSIPMIQNTNDPIPISAILRISLLVVPFNIVYSQMSTTFIVQGTVMTKAFNFIDAPCMNNADAIAVLIFGHFVGSIMYPYLAYHNIKIPTTYKFAIGSAFGGASILWALVVEYWIVTTYQQTGERISILWQAISYILIGAGEIFAVSAAYEVAFKASPPEQKVLFSAVNLFCIGGLPSVVCLISYQLCIPWFQNSSGTTKISHIREYSTAHVNKYFWLLFVLSIFGTLINLLPCIREFVESIEERATDMIRTPKTPMRPPIRARIESSDSTVTDESSIEEQLLASRRHQYYLKYGSGPSLYKHNSMRAGPSLMYTNRSNHNHHMNHTAAQTNHRPSLNSKMLSKLYRSVPAITTTPPDSNSNTNNSNTPMVIMSSSDGQPITMAAAMYSPSSSLSRKNSTEK
jgi:proton-dependent oligopeptide transporter, POT family